ncbi:aldo/keto reductase [Sphingomonas bacterium]|uniref:aldo/keto reductase n=1 Tax=Sphingomonas bacterium TaxID=1895847 RepID=UPI003F68B3BD
MQRLREVGGQCRLDPPLHLLGRGAHLGQRSPDHGCTLLDTAALYGGGENERLRGRAVMHRRSEFTLASKCVLDMIDGTRGLDGSPAAIAGTLDRAMARLGTDHIDFYHLYRLDRRVPVKESAGALVRAKDAGKIGAIGLSEMGAATIRRARATHPIAAVQSEYSPMSRKGEAGVLTACRELGIALVAFSPVARGCSQGWCTTILTPTVTSTAPRCRCPRTSSPWLTCCSRATRWQARVIPP